MTIRPTENWRNPCYPTMQMDTTQVYEAVPACNQPDWEENGLIFAHGHLLAKGEYVIVTREDT